MRNTEASLTYYLNKLSPLLHPFLTHQLNLLACVLSPSFSEHMQSDLFGFQEKKHDDGRDADKVISQDVLAILNFHQCVQLSYQSLNLQLPFAIDDENQRHVFLSIKSSQLTFEFFRIFGLLMQHGQWALMVHYSRPWWEEIPAKSVITLGMNVIWYRSLLWMMIHAATCVYYLIASRNLRVSPYNALSFMHDKMKSIILTQCSNAGAHEAKENYLFVSAIFSLLNHQKQKYQGDWLSWFDDIHDYFLMNEHKSALQSRARLKLWHDVYQLWQSRLYYSVSSYLAKPIAACILFMLTSGYVLNINSSLDTRDHQILLELSSYYLPDTVFSFMSDKKLLPMMFLLGLQLLYYLLTPIIAALLKKSMIEPSINRIKNRYLKQDFIDIMRAVQDRYRYICAPSQNIIEEKLEKIQLIDPLLREMQQYSLQKTFQTSSHCHRFFYKTSQVQRFFYHGTCVVYKALEMFLRMTVAIMHFMMIIIMDNLPKNKCRRILINENPLKRNNLESSKVSHTAGCLFASKVKDENKVASNPAIPFRYRPALL